MTTRQVLTKTNAERINYFPDLELLRGQGPITLYHGGGDLVTGVYCGWEYLPVTNEREWKFRIHFEGFHYDMDVQWVHMGLQWKRLEVVAVDAAGKIVNDA